MLFSIGIAAIAFFSLVIGAIAVVVYFEACSRLQLTLLMRTSNRGYRGNTVGEISMGELLSAIADRRD